MILLRAWKCKQYALRAVAHAILKDGSRVDDVIQDAFLRVLESGREFESEQEAFLYLKKTVLHRSIDAYRTIRRRSQKHSDPKARQACGYGRSKHDEDPLSALLLKEESEDTNQLRSAVKAAMSNLTSKQREAIEVFFFRRGKKLQDLCKETGVPYSTLRSRMLNGIDRIRDYLSQEGIKGFGRKLGHQELELRDGVQRGKTPRTASR